MANHFYANSNNSDASAAPYGTKQTGAWPTNNFGSIKAAVDHGTAPTSGDYIIVSDDHSFLTNASGFSIPTGVTIVCTEAADCAVESSGGTEGDTSGDFGICAAAGGYGVIKGVVISAEDGVQINRVESLKTVYINCDLKPSGQGTPNNGDYLENSGDGGYSELIGCTLSPPDVTGAIISTLAGGTFVRLIDTSIASNTNKPDHLIKSTGAGGVSMVAEGCDFSNLKVNVELVKAQTASAEDVLQLEISNTKMPTTWSPGTINGPGSYVKISNCDDGANRSVSAYKTAVGYAITDNTTHRDSSDQVEGQDVSMLVSTTSVSFLGNPFRFLLGSIRHDFSSQTYIDVQIAHDDIGSGTSSRMQNDEIYFEVEVPNASDPGMTLKTCGPDAVMTYSASDHTNNSEAWTSPPTADNTQVMTVDCGSSGGEGWADIYVCVPLASITAGKLNVCTTMVTRAS